MSSPDLNDKSEQNFSTKELTVTERPYWVTDELLSKPPQEWRLVDIIDISFKSVSDAEQFYNCYAMLVGFSTRKDRLTMNGDIVSMRNMVCSHAGFRRSAKPSQIETSTSYSRLVTRCGCKASFKVKYSTLENMYCPVEFNTEHNHKLAPSDSAHFLRSHRDVDEYTAHQISQLRAVGIKPSKIMNVLVNSCGGYEWVGFTRKDLYNHVYMSTKARQKINDTHLAMQYIQAIAAKDPGVYCKYNCDSECRLTRVFYTDTISRAEYRAFGDVIICDSTYNTNEFKLPFVFIVGVDNHHSTIVFACALVSDETHETYQWVFQTFLNCMEDKQPRSIITDGDRAMRSAIAQVMPKARHRLCGWHLLRNANGISKHPNFKHSLSKLIMKRSDPICLTCKRSDAHVIHSTQVALFYKKWNELYMVYHVSFEMSNVDLNRYPVPVFSEKWSMFLTKYELDQEERRWVTDMQQSAHLWAETFFANCFFAGTVTNGRAETMNKSLKGFVNIHLPLSQLFHKYLMCLDSLRQTAMAFECLNSQTMPPIHDTAFHSIRMQLAETYTNEIYKKVDDQIKKEHLFRADMLNLSIGSPELRFSVKRYDAGNTSNIYYVTWHRPTNWLKCFCGLMESDGYPCSHIFAVMKQMNITEVGPNNLIERWNRTARSMCVLSSSYAQHVSGQAHRLTTIRPYCETLTYLSSLGDEHMQIAQNEIQQLCQRLSTIERREQDVHGLTADGGEDDQYHNSIHIADPMVARTKGAPRTNRVSTPRHCSVCKEVGHTKRTCGLQS